MVQKPIEDLELSRQWQTLSSKTSVVRAESIVICAWCLWRFVGNQADCLFFLHVNFHAEPDENV